MIRTFITPTQTNYNLALELPEDYLGQELELILFKKQEGLFNNKKKAKKFTSFSKIKIDTSAFKFSRDQANER